MITKRRYSRFTGIYTNFPLKQYVFLALSLMGVSAYSQRYLAEAALPQIQTSGFYRILLEPAVTSAANASLSNLRILTGSSEIPYLMLSEEPILEQTNFKEYKIVSKQLQANCCTRLTLHNPKRVALYNVSLQIKNADTRKQASLYGSDDQTTWYALKENFQFDAISNPNETFEMRILHFPLSNYEYLSIVINDSTSAPLNILAAGFYETKSGLGQYTQTPHPRLSVTENKKRKETQVQLAFDSAQLVNKIEFTIAGPQLYHRQARLYEQSIQKNKRGKQETIKRFLQYVDLTSTHAPTILMEEGKFKNLVLIIENDDNPPLNITNATTFQLNRYLVAWLEAGKMYNLALGPENLTAPVYDIGYFREKMPQAPPVLQSGKLSGIVAPSQAPKSLFSKPLIWGAITAVGLFLVYMIWRMMREEKAA